MGPVQRSLVFFAIAVGLGAPFAAIYAWSAATGSQLVGILSLVAYMASPAGAALVLAWLHGVPVRDALGLRPRRSWWWVGAWGGPVAVALGAAALSLAMPGTTFTPDLSGWFARLDLPPEQIALAREQLAMLPSPLLVLPLALIQAVLAGSTINALAAFGEEAGWRGWLHHELRPLGFWTCSAWTGVLWGLWHAPLILQGYNYPDHPVIGVFLMVAMCTGLSPAMTLIRDRTGTALSAAVFHGTFNALAGLPLLFLAGGSDLTVGVTGMAGLLVLVALNAVVAATVR